MYNSSGKAVRMLGAMEDVSLRKKVEDELYRSRQMIQLVLDHIPQRVFWKDRNYRYLGCNKLFLGDAVLSELSQILGKEDFELNWKDTAPLYRADDRLVMETNKVGFVYHASYLRFFERARSEVLDAAGYPMGDIAAGSHRFVVYEGRIRFRTPARLGDRLDIRTRVERSSGYRVTFHQEAARAADAATLATADVDVVSLDPNGKLQELPASLSAIWTAGGAPTA